MTKVLLDNLAVEQQKIEDARDKGMTQGMTQGMAQGMAQGIAQGMAQGIAQGMAQGMTKGMVRGVTEGEKNKAIAIAKKMLLKRNSVEEIIEMTELSKEEIEKIKSD
jgi:flagellar biosynthesis/type III secretory pathway protein FliH